MKRLYDSSINNNERESKVIKITPSSTSASLLAASSVIGEQVLVCFIFILLLFLYLFIFILVYLIILFNLFNVNLFFKITLLQQNDKYFGSKGLFLLTLVNKNISKLAIMSLNLCYLFKYI